MSQVMVDSLAEARDIQTAKEIGDALESHYPGWGWLVNVRTTMRIDETTNMPIEGGIVDILNLKLMGLGGKGQKGYRFFLTNDVSPEARKKRVVMYGGEYLERAGMPRKGWNESLVPKTLDVS